MRPRAYPTSSISLLSESSSRRNSLRPSSAGSSRAAFVVLSADDASCCSDRLEFLVVRLELIDSGTTRFERGVGCCLCLFREVSGPPITGMNSGNLYVVAVFHPRGISVTNANINATVSVREVQKGLLPSSELELRKHGSLASCGRHSVSLQCPIN